jgi:hypothetical protein
MAVEEHPFKLVPVTMYVEVVGTAGCTKNWEPVAPPVHE